VRTAIAPPIDVGELRRPILPLWIREGKGGNDLPPIPYVELAEQ